MPVMKAELCKAFLGWSWDGCHPHLPWAPCSKNHHQGKGLERPFENPVFVHLPASIGTSCPSSVFRRSSYDSCTEAVGGVTSLGTTVGSTVALTPKSQCYVDGTFHRPGDFKKQTIMPVTL